MIDPVNPLELDTAPLIETYVPRQCARPMCMRPRRSWDGGDPAGRYCSTDCQKISAAAHGPSLGPDPAWSWTA